MSNITTLNQKSFDVTPKAESNLVKQAERVELAGDIYFVESLKNCMKEKRGVGVRTKVTGNCLLPTNWMKFLRCSWIIPLFIKCSCKGNTRRSGSVNSI